MLPPPDLLTLIYGLAHPPIFDAPLQKHDTNIEYSRNFPEKRKRSSKVNRKVSEFPNCYKEVHRRDSSTAAGLTVSDSVTIARRAVESRSERPRFLNGSICRVMYPLCRSWGGVTQRPRLQGVSFLSTLRGGGAQIRRDS